MGLVLLLVVPLIWDPAPRPGTPKVLFEIETANPLGFDASADGKQFFIVELDENSWTSNRVDVVLDWFVELRERASE